MASCTVPHEAAFGSTTDAKPGDMYVAAETEMSDNIMTKQTSGKLYRFTFLVQIEEFTEKDIDEDAKVIRVEIFLRALRRKQ